MRIRNHGLFTRSVAAIVSTTLVGTTVLQGCGEDDEIAVEVVGEYKYERAVVTFETDGGFKQVEEFDLDDQAVTVPVGATKATLDTFWKDSPIGSSVIVGDLKAKDSLRFEIGLDAKSFDTGSFAKQVSFPFRAGEGEDIGIVVELAPGVNPLDVTGTVGPDGPLGELYPPRPLEVCGQHLCGNYAMYWSGMHKMQIALQYGTQVAAATVPVDGTYSPVTDERAAMLAGYLEQLPDGTLTQLPEDAAEFLSYAQCAVLYTVIAKMNEEIQAQRLVIVHAAAMAMLATVAVQPAALVGNTQQYVILPWIGVALRIAAAVLAWLRARLTWTAIRAAAPGAATFAARQAFYAAVATAAIATAQALYAVSQERAANAEKLRLMLQNNALQADIDRVKAEIAEQDRVIKALEQANAENQQKLAEEQAREAAEQQGQ